MSSTLRIEVIIFAAPSAILLVRCGYLQNAHTSDLHISQKTGAIAAGAFNANPLQVSERPRPCQHQLVALPRCGEALRSQNLVIAIYNSSDMKVFVCMNPTQDWDGLYRFCREIILFRQLQTYFIVKNARTGQS